METHAPATSSQSSSPSRPAPPRGLLAVRHAARRRLASVAEVAAAGWTVHGIRRVEPMKVALEVGPAGGQGVVLEWAAVPSDGSTPRAFLTGEHYAVGYRTSPGAWDLDAADTPSEIKRLGALALRSLVEAAPGVPLAESAAVAEPVPVAFDPDGVQAWLFGHLAEGQELVDGWLLEEIFDGGDGDLAFSFEGTEDTGRFVPTVKVRLRDDSRKAAFRTPGLDVSYRLVFGETTDERRVQILETVARELALVLEAADHGVRFEPSADVGEVREGAEAVPDGVRVQKALNLAIPAPCGFECTFCSVREEIYPVMDPNAPLVDSLKEDIRRASRRGATLLRINGIEPLNAPYLFDLLEVAAECGYEEYTLHSTVRPLHRKEFADRFLAAMPDKFRIYAPIYGSTAERHEAVTGAPGSFEQLMEAVGRINAHLAEREAEGRRGGQLVFTTVLTRENIDDLVGMRTLVAPLATWWEVHLPFPNTSSKTDRYREVAVRMSDALEAAYPKGWWPVADLAIGEILPCVALSHEERTGHRLVTVERLQTRIAEPSGTYYKSAGFEHSFGDDRAAAFLAATTPCPHASECTLAVACPRKVYRLYEMEFGLDELQPVTRERLSALPQGGRVLAYLGEGRG